MTECPKTLIHVQVTSNCPNSGYIAVYLIDTQFTRVENTFLLHFSNFEKVDIKIGNSWPIFAFSHHFMGLQ